MIYLVTSREDQYDSELLKSKDIIISNAKDFKNWTLDKDCIQLDTETNVVDRLILRKLFIVQIGDKDGKDQWLFEITGLSGLKLKYLKDFLNNKSIQKIIHNSLFEYTILKKEFNIDIANIRDTMLMSKILNTGLKNPKGFHSLVGCIKRYLSIDIDKAMQTSFSEDIMSVEQIFYAATDVTLLGKLHDAMQLDIDHWELENVVKLECAVVRPYGDAMLFNFMLDKDKWRENMHERETELAQALDSLYNMMRKDLYKECVENGFIQKNDAYHFNWGSTKMKNQLMRIIYPEIPVDCTTLPAFKAFFKQLESLKDDTLNLEPLERYLNRDFDYLEKYFITKHHNILEELGLFIPKDRILINFNSPEQTLRLFQLIAPEILNTEKETIQKINHPLAKTFRTYMRIHKLATSYGENYLDACDEDGMLRIPDINQIIETGRTSLKLYQLLPGDDKYRGCFYPPKGYKVVDIDYSSQELVVAASLSNEEAILNALKNNWDMHSICASMLFPKEWAECGEDPNPKGKPKTEKGNKFRAWSKRISFGIMYGKSAVGLAEDLDLFISTDDLMEFYEKEVLDLIQENHLEFFNFCKQQHNGKDNKASRKAFVKFKRSEGLFLPEEITGDDLINRFRNAFPNLHDYLISGADKAVLKSYIRTKDFFGRIRFFSAPDSVREEKAIHRAAMNMPIQGGSSNMTKYAVARIKKEIEDNNLSDKVCFALPIHDEIVTFAKDEYADEWMKTQMRIMEEAGSFILDNDLQKAEGKITDVWQK